MLERFLPTRLGRSFRWLIGASWVTNLGDGIGLAAGPLLVASQTSDARLVALAAALNRVPWLLLGLFAGAIADRVDRRVLVIVANLMRLAVLLVLCGIIATGQVNIAAVLATSFLLGVAEVFADTTASTLTPMLVDKEDLGIANARLQTGFLTLNQIAGPPVGALLFGLGMLTPFAVQAISLVLGIVLVSRIQTPKGAVREVDSHVWRDIVAGVRWVHHHKPVRTLALTIFVFNITWGAAWSVLVLYATVRLGMGEIGFGLLTTAAAVGGLASTAAYGWLERRIELATLMRACLLLEVLTHLALALTTVPWVAMVIMVIFGAYAFVWGTLSSTVRQRAVPKEFQGRVSSVYLVGVLGGLVFGQVLGGVIADRWGLAAPFWFAFVGSGVTLILIWRALAQIAHLEPSTD